MEVEGSRRGGGVWAGWRGAGGGGGRGAGRETSRSDCLVVSYLEIERFPVQLERSFFFGWRFCC